MRRAQKYRITMGIAQALAKSYDHAGIDLYLKAFDIDTPHRYDAFGDSREAYIIGTVADANIYDILEMAEDLGVSTLGVAGQLSPPPKIWPNNNNFRLFISHISKDKDKATRLRDCLTPYHISGFVAHQDIHPTAIWQVEIECALHLMDAFLAIHTEGFSKSVWTQQEIGFAVARGVRIISFKMGEDPTGFISKQQALPRLKRTAEAIAKEVNAILLADDLTAARMNEVVVAHTPKRKANHDDVSF
jgi:hypothetical protein